MRKLIPLIFLVLLEAMPIAAHTGHALIIGLGKHLDTRWGKIHGDNDVRIVEELLRKNGYTDIEILTNEQATKEAIVAAFRTLATQCGKSDAVVIHYSGHGQLMTDLNGDEAERWGERRHAQWDESWIPYDAYMTYGPEDRGEKHLCDDELAGLLTAIRQKIGERGKLTVIVDACHSGDATCGEENEYVRGVDIKFNIPIDATEQKESGPALVPERWQTVSACRPYQLCTEMKELNIGKLTYALYTLGDELFVMNNEELQNALDNFMERHQGRLPQNPMVTGSR